MMVRDGINPRVDFYFSNPGKWQKELTQLRSIVLDCGLTEELKWGVPCYTFPTPVSQQKKNIVLLHIFKEYCAMLFFKGSLLNDAQGILVQQTKQVQAARQVRFTNARDIVKKKTILKAYIYEAIEIEKAGLKVTLKKTAAYPVPREFKNILDKNPALESAFKALTPGRQRGYLLYFAAAKQSKTRESRVRKYTVHILSGRGLNDQ